MSNTKNTMTNAQALAAAIELAQAANMEELTAKLTRMYNQATKPRISKPTIEQLQTKAQIKDIQFKMTNNGIETIDTKWIMDNIDYVTSAQKATAIMRRGIAQGLFVKGEPVKGRVTYLLANNND